MLLYDGREWCWGVGDAQSQCACSMAVSVALLSKGHQMITPTKMLVKTPDAHRTFLS